MKTWNRIKLILECLHPVFLLSWICPVLYLFFGSRQEDAVVKLYLCGWVLLLVSVPARIAVKETEGLGLYLLTGAVSAAAAYMAARYLGERLFTEAVRTGYEVSVAAGSFFIVTGTMSVRMRDHARKKAMEENDITWREDAVVLEKPALPFAAVFAVVYAAGMFTSCPAACDAALLSGALYLLTVLAYRFLETTDAYLEKTRDVRNVPASKIRRIGAGATALVLLVTAAAAGAAFLTGGLRRYDDMREWKLSLPPGGEEDWYQPPMDMELPGPEAGLILQEEADMGDPSPILEALARGLMLAACVFVIAGITRAVISRFLLFRGGTEENGDVAESLREDVSEKIEKKKRRGLRRGDPDQIRRKYRRVIRRYRKDTPGIAETPAEIEAAADFQEGFDVQGLHEEYEKARYSG